MSANENSYLLNNKHAQSSFTFMKNQQTNSQDFQLGLQSMGSSQIVSNREIPLASDVCNKDFFLSRTVKPFFKMVMAAEKDPETVMMNYLKDKHASYQEIMKSLLAQQNLRVELADNIKLIEEKNLDYVFQDEEEMMANNQFKANERIEREMEKHIRRCVRFTSFWPEMCIFKTIFDRSSNVQGQIQAFSSRDRYIYLGKKGRADMVTQWKFFDTEKQQEIILQRFSEEAKYSSLDYKKQLRIFEVQKNQEYENTIVSHDPSRLQLSFYSGICSLKELNDEKKKNGMPWSEREILFMIYSLVQNLISLRKQKYYYQDIKPENIVVYNIKKGQFSFKLSNNPETAASMLCSAGTRQLHGERSCLNNFGTVGTKIYRDPRIVSKRNAGEEISEKDVEQANNYSLAISVLEILLSNQSTNTPEGNDCYVIQGWKDKRIKRKRQQAQQAPLSKRSNHHHHHPEREDNFSLELDESIDQIKDKYPRVSSLIREILVTRFQEGNQEKSSFFLYKDTKRQLKDFEENQQPLFFVDDRQQSISRIIYNKSKYSYLQICNLFLQETFNGGFDSPLQHKQNNKEKQNGVSQQNLKIQQGQSERQQDQNNTQQNSSISQAVQIEYHDAFESISDELECCFSFGYLERARIVLELAKNLPVPSPGQSNLGCQFNEMIEWYSSKLAGECCRFHDAIQKLEKLQDSLELRQGQDGLKRNVREKLVETYFCAGLVKKGIEQLKEVIKDASSNSLNLNSEYLYKHALLFLFQTQKYTDCLVIIHNVLNKYVSYIQEDIYHPMLARCMNLRIIILSQQGDYMSAFRHSEIYQKYVKAFQSQEKDLFHQPNHNIQQNENDSFLDNQEQSQLNQSSLIHDQSSQLLQQSSIIDKQGLQNVSGYLVKDEKNDYLKREKEKYDMQQQQQNKIQQNYYLEEQQCIGKLNYISAALNVKAIQNKKVLLDVILSIVTQIEDREGTESASPLYLFALIIKAKCCIHSELIDEARIALRYVLDSILTRHCAFDARNYKILYPALFIVKLLNNPKFDTTGISKIQLHEWILQKLKSIQHGASLLLGRQRITYSYALFQTKDYENAEKQSISAINSMIFTLGSRTKSVYPLYSLDTKLHGYYMYKMGIYMANENAFKDSLAQFNDCLRSMQDLHNKTDYFLGECLFQKAFCQYHLKQFDQGLITAMKAYNLLVEESRLFSINRPIMQNQNSQSNKQKDSDDKSEYSMITKWKENEKYVNPQQEIYQATYIVALLYNKLGNFIDSLDYCQKCIQSPITVHKENMLRLGHCKMLAANNQKTLKRLVDALLLAEQSLQIYDKVLPSHHPDLLQSVYLIYTILRDLSYFNEAKQQMKWVQKINKTIIKNANNALKSIDFQNMSKTWLSIGQPDFAIEYLQKSLDINLKDKGLKHPLIAVDLINLASVHKDLPNAEDKFKAIDFLEEAYQIFKHKENYEYEENIQNQPFLFDNNELQLQTVLRLLRAIENCINFLTRDSSYVDQLKAIDIVHSYDKIGFMKQLRKLILKDPYSQLQIAEFTIMPERFLGYTFLCVFPYLNKHAGYLSVFSKKEYSFELDTHKVILNIYNNNTELVGSFVKDATPKKWCKPNILYNVINTTKEVLYTVEETQHRYKENEIYLIKNTLQDKVGELEIAQKEGFPSQREMRIFLLDQTFTLETKYILSHLPLLLMIHRYGS